MRVLLLVILGATGALGVLRGIELLLVSHETGRAVSSLAIGLLFTALFLKQWKRKSRNASASG